MININEFLLIIVYLIIMYEYYLPSFYQTNVHTNITTFSNTPSYLY